MSYDAKTTAIELGYALVFMFLGTVAMILSIYAIGERCYSVRGAMWMLNGVGVANLMAGSYFLGKLTKPLEKEDG